MKEIDWSVSLVLCVFLFFVCVLCVLGLLWLCSKFINLSLFQAQTYTDDQDDAEARR
jgi:hypothetical protein